MDNYEAYMNIRREDIQFYIHKSINNTHFDIARVLSIMFRGQFLCCSIKNNAWYEFKNHLWCEMDAGIQLRMKISNDLVDEYIKLMYKYTSQIAAGINEENSITEEEKEEMVEMCKMLHKITNNLKTSNFKDKIMIECKELFYEHKFLNKLDSNPYLIGFENGVYDLKNYEFRDGRPEDYLSMTTGNDYLEFEPDDPRIESVNTFMGQLFPKKEVRDYMWCVLASCIQGINVEEKFRFLTGTGANGKSCLNELFNLAFGEYCIKFPITLLTQKRAKSNVASPEVIIGKGKRYGYFEEPDEDEKINVGLMKEYSGNDKVKGRGLYQSPIEFKPQWKLFVYCNSLPTMPPHDGGTWRRAEAIEFGSKFVDKPRLSNEYPIDSHLKEKLPEWKEAFMFLLIQHYKRYRKYGIKVPDQVVAFTKEYQNENDLYLDFVKNYLVKTDDPEGDTISIKELYEHFKYWYSQSFSNKAPSRSMVKKYLTKSLGGSCISKDTLKGFRISTASQSSDDPANADDFETRDIGKMLFSKNNTSTSSSSSSSTGLGQISVIKKCL